MEETFIFPTNLGHKKKRKILSVTAPYSHLLNLFMFILPATLANPFLISHNVYPVDGISTHVVAPSSTFQGVRNCCFCYAAHHRGALYTVVSVLEICGLDFFFSCCYYCILYLVYYC